MVDTVLFWSRFGMARQSHSDSSCIICLTCSEKYLTWTDTLLFHKWFLGVESFDINFDEQKVTVKGNVQPDAVFQTVSKTGKKTAFWEAETPPPPPAEGAESKPSEPEPAPAPAPAAAI